MIGGTFALVGVLAARVVQANKKFGKINSKTINYSHIGLMIWGIFMTSYSLNIIFQLIFNFDTAFKKMYVEYGLFDPSMNLLVWILNTIANVFVLFTIFGLAMRSEKARKILLVSLPLLFIVVGIKTVNELIVKNSADIPFGFVLSIAVIIMLIGYLPLFLFYRSRKVKNLIFNATNTHNKVDTMSA